MELLQERGTTHGVFDDNAVVAQALKNVMRSRLGWCELPPVQKEALDLIATKISRILSGKADFKDHWDDIAGYATLGSKACPPSS